MWNWIVIYNIDKVDGSYYMLSLLDIFAMAYTQATSRCMVQLKLETSLAKALIEENGYSLVEINNDG